MNRSRSRIYFIGLYLCLAACGSESASEIKTIFGHFDLKVLTRSQTETSLQRSVGAIFLASLDQKAQASQMIKFCSGIQISPRHVLSNAHCLKKKSEDTYVDLYFSKDYVALDGEEKKYTVDDAGGSLYLRFRGATLLDPETAHAPNLKPLFVSSTLDYAIFEITEQGFDSEHIDLARAPEIQEPSTAGLLAYPNAMPLTWSDSCQITPYLKGESKHDCDSTGGSSGGLLFDALSGAPLALHRQGVFNNSIQFYREHGRSEEAAELAARECREKFKIDEQSPDLPACIKFRSEHFGFNRAIPLADIRADLTKEAPDLAQSLSTAPSAE